MKQPTLAKDLQQMTGIFEKLLESLSTLRGLSSIELPQEQEDALLRQALTALLEHYGIERCSVFLLEQDRLINAAGLDWQEWQGDSPTPSPGLETNSYAVLETLMGLAVRSGQPQLCTDCSSDPRFAPLPKDSLVPLPGSLLSAPISAGGRVLGVLNLSHPDSNHFGDWHLRLVPLFCSFLGQMLAGNRLLKGLEDEVVARTRQLEEVLSETRLLKEHYRNLSMLDELTGLYNRRYFFLESRLTLGRALRYRHEMTLMVLDIDRFKTINDRHGHAQGDIVLRDLGLALQSQLRDTDILARVGGEEFAIVLTDTGQEGAREAGQRLLQAVRALQWQTPDGPLSARISLGMVSLASGEARPPGNSNLDALQDQLYSQADSAMYAAKKAGGDRLQEAPP
ncbi:MAG: sensor domain-containing diguanylate cyclase [Trichloromonadaceae bacterium]